MVFLLPLTETLVRLKLLRIIELRFVKLGFNKPQHWSKQNNGQKSGDISPKLAIYIIKSLCPQGRSNLQTCALILKLYIIQCIIYLSITSCFIFSCNNCYINRRSKMNWIKSERFGGVSWKLWWKILISLYLSFVCLTKPGLTIFNNRSIK